MTILPKRKRGRQSDAAIIRYESDLQAFVEKIIQIDSTLDFRVSSRGWCYLLEEHGLGKDEFDAAQSLINDCRKSGKLPLNICSDDDGRAFKFVESIDDTDTTQEADWIVSLALEASQNYQPFSFWDFQDWYIQIVVEKIDLKNLFAPICKEFNIPIANARGWSDLNMRAAMMRRFEDHEAAGRKIVLLYCGDHDPAGLNISNSLRSNLAALVDAVGWSPDNLVIDRFGLNADFIEQNNLTWIDNLKTGKATPPNDLADPKHPDHFKDYVQEYLAEFGAHKVEANVLVARQEAGRALFREAISAYLDQDGIKQFHRELAAVRASVDSEVLRLMAEQVSP